MMNMWIQYLKIKKGEAKTADQRLNLNIHLCKIRCLGVPDITDYKLVFITHKFKTMNLMRRTEIIKINRFGWNPVHGRFCGQ